jgi:hypothetical protein
MFKADAQEAAGICETVLTLLLAQAPLTGRPGSTLRNVTGMFLANAKALLMADTAGAYLVNIFWYGSQCGITLPQIETVRRVAAAQNPVLEGAIVTRDTLIRLALSTAGTIIAGMQFTSREDVDALRLAVNAAFAPSEEAAADKMDAPSYQALIKLHAAIMRHLIVTARPLPRMLNYHFASPLPTLVQAYRLYDDASRADELRAENGIVHPAFAPANGRALSA